MSTAKMREELENQVLAYLSEMDGGTAWRISLRLGTSREEISKTCQRLKNKGLISASGSYWQGVKAK